MGKEEGEKEGGIKRTREKVGKLMGGEIWRRKRKEKEIERGKRKWWKKKGTEKEN